MIRLVYIWALVQTAAFAEIPGSNWCCVTGDVVTGLPARVDVTGDGRPELLAPSRSGCAVICIRADGGIVRRIERPCMVAGIASAGVQGPWAVEETSGRIAMFHAMGDTEFASIQLPGEPLPGGGVLFSDIDRDSEPELLCARRDGVVTVFSRALVPIWQFDSGLTLETAPVAAPVFNVSCAILIRSGPVLQAVSGGGRPLWRFHASHDGDGADSMPLVARLGGPRPSVYLSQGSRLYAIDILKGKEQWRVHVPDSAEGSPVVVEHSRESGRSIMVAGRNGHVSMVTPEGELAATWSLPPGQYDPRPMVGDWDGDGQPEAVFAHNEGFVAVSFSGEVRERFGVPQPVFTALTDVDEDGCPDLLASTRTGRLFAFRSKSVPAPYQEPGAGYVLPLPPEVLRVPEKSSRRAQIAGLYMKQFSERDPFGLAVIQPRLPKRAAYVSVLIRQQGAVLGGAYKPAHRDAVAVPFIRRGPGPLAIDLGIHDSEGGLIASSGELPVRSRTVKLINIPSLSRFLAAIEQAVEEYVPVSASIESGAPRLRAQLGAPCSSLELARVRGLARDAGTAWDAAIRADYDLPVYGRGRLSRGLMERLGLAARMAGAESVAGLELGTLPRISSYGLPHTPIGFVVKPGDTELLARQLLRHVFGYSGPRHIEQDVMTSSPYGEICDLVPADFRTESARRYAVIWPLVDAPLDRQRRQALVAFARGGGILVLNANAAQSFPTEITGVAFTGRHKVAELIQTAIATGPPPTAPYRYAEMEPGMKSRALAWTEAGDAVMTWRPLGDGVVIILASATDADEAGQILYLGPALLQILAARLMPIQMPQGVQTYVNRVPDGWLVGLFANDGIRPLSRDATAPDEPERDVVLRFPRRGPLQFQSVLGRFAWDNAANGVVTRMAPGAAAAVKAVLP